MRKRPGDGGGVCSRETHQFLYKANQWEHYSGISSCFFWVLSLRTKGLFVDVGSRRMRRVETWLLIAVSGDRRALGLPFCFHDAKTIYQVRNSVRIAYIRCPAYGMESGGRFCRTALSAPRRIIWLGAYGLASSPRTAAHWISVLLAAIGGNCRFAAATEMRNLPLPARTLTYTRHIDFAEVLRLTATNLDITGRRDWARRPYAVCGRLIQHDVFCRRCPWRLITL